ncbi:hypothetical protein IVB36_38820 [Bradyrhizobium sp. 35]|uniref:hypothetical protein n=1 Tax=Bradyrhizobium sp. 35 TaxID=2782670 RepID=UPI001FFA9FDE|nr:hypothetical protein [Bradyrhizobium sp. 35]MCK1456679.1 hypothetical protein [Bradyrhizobium sp. 35]
MNEERSTIQAAVARAVADERRRLARIMGTPEAAGQEKLALTLATTTSKSTDEVRALLTANKPAAIATATGSTAAEAVAAERRRLSAVCALSEAKGREDLAMHLATTTDMTVDQIKAALAAAPAAVAGERASDTDIGPSFDQGKQQQNSQSVSAMWDAALTSRRLPMQATATPNPQHHTPNPPGLPDWNASLKSRGMKTN